MASATTDASEVRRRGRQRLIGAVAIVLLLVVFVPMLLDSEPKKSRDESSLEIPSKDDAPALPAPAKGGAQSSVAPAQAPVVPAQAPVVPAQAPVVPAQASVAPAQAGAQSPASAPAKASDASTGTSASPKAPAPATEPSKAAQAPSANRTPASAGVTSPVAMTNAAPKLEGFAVQVGAFRDEAKLKGARDKLTAAGIPHYTERLDTSTGSLTRLRAGPFPTRQAADAAAARLKEASLPSQVVPLP
jgi:DedD protein